MKMYRSTIYAVAVGVILLVISGGAFSSAAESIFKKGFSDFNNSSQEIFTNEANWKSTGTALTVSSTGGKYRWPGISFTDKRDFSAYDTVTAKVKNTSDVAITLAFRIDDPETKQKNTGWPAATRSIDPGATVDLEVSLPVPVPQYVLDKVYGMRGLPGNIQADTNSGRGNPNRFDRSKIEALQLYACDPPKKISFKILGISASNRSGQKSGYSWMKMSESEFFPMIDKYGQFKHDEWPGKIHSDADLQKAKLTEASDLETHPGYSNRDRFGGWKNGPKQQATGHFRTEKVNGKWWLVDPDGNLFWSHGVDCVRFDEGTTGISDREHLFEDLPAKGSEFAQFYGRSQNAAHGFYANRKFETYCFLRANLYRKYGPDYKEAYTKIVHERIPSWGLNTIANWSTPEIYMAGKTPYTITVGTWSPKIEGSSGFWGKFPDPFHPEFIKSVESGLDRHKDSLDDPWCIGIFVNNEIAWGGDTSLSEGSLVSPKTQPSKIALINWLKDKYNSIDKLNAVWKTSFADWNALSENQNLPKGTEFKPDMKEFYAVIADTYFKNIHEVLRRKAPNKLDLGCRFAWKNNLAVVVSTRYLDVVSFNMYTTSVADFALPEGSIDRPCIIGEFHFGALDRGMLHTGLVKRKDQNDRAETYRSYVEGALDNPYWVGTHWFQMTSQATTGRTDGENYQIGFVDFCDTPYVETIDALRQTGAKMYERRYNGK